MGRGRGRIMGGGGRLTSRWLRNKGCVLCHREVATEVIRETWWACASCRCRRQHRCTAIFHAQVALVAMQTDGKEGLCIAARTVGFTTNLSCTHGNLEQETSSSLFTCESELFAKIWLMLICYERKTLCVH